MGEYGITSRFCFQSIVLAEAGGNDLKTITYNILKKLNSLAAKLKMEGRNRQSLDAKPGFKNLKNAFGVFHGKLYPLALVYNYGISTVFN